MRPPALAPLPVEQLWIEPPPTPSLSLTYPRLTATIARLQGRRKFNFRSAEK
jgi:hypothetical protein